MIEEKESTLVIEVPGQRRREMALDPEQPCTLGRAHDNCVALNDPAVSRHHCRIAYRQGTYWVEDLGSRNGTQVNDVILDSPHLLVGGDRIQVGSCRFYYTVEQGSGPVELTESEKPVTVRAMDLGTILGKSYDTTAQRRVQPEDAAATEFFHQFDRVGQVLLVHCPLSELYQIIVDLVGEILSPDRAALLFPEGDEEVLIARALYHSENVSDSDIQVSRSIARQALDERQSILVQDAQHDQRFQEQQSVILERIQSALCVPLWDDHQVIGLLYADKRSPLMTYNEDHLRLLTLVGHFAAVKIRETMAQEELQRRAQIEEELKNAAKMQQQFLPGEALEGEGYRIAGSNIPCLGVGGDYFDYIEHEDGSVILALGDVSGKGMSAALLMANLHANIHAITETDLTLDMMAERLNRSMYLSTQGRRFVTLFLARYEPSTRELVYVNAGHNRPMLRHKSGETEELSIGGLMLGAFPEASYETGAVQLAVGDLLFIYSDGITEAESPAEEFYGEERLQGFIDENCDLGLEDFVQKIMDEVHTFSHPDPPNDDITAVILSIL